MKAAKVLIILAFVYLGIVVTFESLLGYFQPQNQQTLIITTTDKNGVTNSRVLSRLESGGKLFVAANHWPRAWYNEVLENPRVQIELDGETGKYLAVSATRTEHDRIQEEKPLGFVIRFLTGFPPRYFVRLDPQ